jgi:hypothetical protein
LYGQLREDLGEVFRALAEGKVRIPTIAPTQSEGKRPVVPGEAAR